MDTEMLIGSRFEAGAGDKEQVLNPRTGKLIEGIPEASTSQIDAAVNAAEKAFATWSRTTPAQRSGYLLKIADAIEEDAAGFRGARGAQLRQADQRGDQRRNPGDRRLLAVLRGRGADHACAGRGRISAGPHLDGPARPDRHRRPRSRPGTIR